MDLDPDDTRPPYLQLADRLRRAVADGAYATGEKFPSVRALAEEHGTAKETVSKAIRVLKEEGVLRTVGGIGTVIRDLPVADGLRPPALLQEQVADLRRRVEVLEQHAVERDR